MVESQDIFSDPISASSLSGYVSARLVPRSYRIRRWVASAGALVPKRLALCRTGVMLAPRTALPRTVVRLIAARIARRLARRLAQSKALDYKKPPSRKSKKALKKAMKKAKKALKKALNGDDAALTKKIARDVQRIAKTLKNINSNQARLSSAVAQTAKGIARSDRRVMAELRNANELAKSAATNSAKAAKSVDLAVNRASHRAALGAAGLAIAALQGKKSLQWSNVRKALKGVGDNSGKSTGWVAPQYNFTPNTLDTTAADLNTIAAISKLNSGEKLKYAPVISKDQVTEGRRAFGRTVRTRTQLRKRYLKTCNKPECVTARL